MKKILFKSLLLIAFLFGSITSSAYDFESKGIYYNITSPEDKTVEVTYLEEYNTYSGSVVIPASVKNKGTTYSVTSIGEMAFAYCDNSTSITIPRSVTSINITAFEGGEGLKQFKVAVENPNFSALDGVLFNKNKTTIVAYPNAKSSTYKIPNSVTLIGKMAFRDCSNLKTVTIPKSVTAIGEMAFQHCGLTDITIPNSVTSIGANTFYDSKDLKNVKIGNSVISIGEGAFWNCKGLKSITIPNSVSSIGDVAFESCESLTQIYNYSNEPQSIESNVFNEVDKTKCTLYIKKGLVAKYKTADVWKDFKNIQEIDTPKQQ